MSICGNCYFILTLLGVCHETVNFVLPLIECLSRVAKAVDSCTLCLTVFDLLLCLPYIWLSSRSSCCLKYIFRHRGCLRATSHYCGVHFEVKTFRRCSCVHVESTEGLSHRVCPDQDLVVANDLLRRSEGGGASASRIRETTATPSDPAK